MNTCQVAKSGLLDRFFRLTPLPPEAYEDTPGMVPGGLMLDVEIRVGLVDRIKLLLTGKAFVTARVKTDVPVARAVSFVSFSVVARHVRQR